MGRFPPVPPEPDFPTQELRVLDLWEQTDAFRRSVHGRDPARSFVFYDGPPFATGVPHYGHLVPSTIKDVVPRYWTMRGYRVERRFGWDTHGLPIEMLVEQSLGLSGPSAIRAYGVDKFNEACRANVLTYVSEWRRIIGRLGRWVDFDDDYKTMDATFMESVWWAFRTLWDKGLVYKAFRVMPYSWRLSTSLSNFEANLDYRDVQDPAITVTMPIKGVPSAVAKVSAGDVLLIWTTTPWSLPANLGVAVREDVPYVRARRAGDDTVYVLAEARLHAVLGADATVVSGPFPGSELLGLSYEPLFSYFLDTENAFRVIPSPHVTTEDGTGLVHMAPDFGEEDLAACQAAGIGVLQPVDEEGNFVPAVTDFVGRNIKEADPDIIRHLKERGRILRHDTITHSYPFCWRSGTPLIYMALPAWFVRVTDLRDRMVAHNDTIHWVPEAVGAKRFGNWLQDARDWNISRNRFWGTPIPIWQCDRDATHQVCVGSISELALRTGAVITDLHPHKIDHLTFPCECGGTQRRISFVFDCWFESGAMPYGQAHYPFEHKDAFDATYPAQFIAEGLDQTRGWFYTLLVLSTALFDRPSFRNCVVNGLVLAEDGAKMSKSKKNFPPLESIFEQYGADAVRAYLINSPVVRADPVRFSEAGVRDIVRTVLLPLHHALSFFVQYANVDGWSPDDPRPDVSTRPELDRWLLSHLQSLVREVDAQMELYQLYNVVPPVLGYIDDLTNWYIRLSRRRFWRPVGGEDKAAAYATLYEVLVTFSKVLAPFLPFVAEVVYQELVVGAGKAKPGDDSVHLTDWPEVRDALVDRALEDAVAHVRDAVRLGRRLRERHRLKTRQPLRRLTIVHHDAAVREAFETHRDQLLDELNVRELAVRARGDELATLSCKANFKTLGKRFGKEMKDAAAVIEAFDNDTFVRLEDGAAVEVLGKPVTLEDVVVRREPRGDVVIETEGGLVVALDTELDDALRREGMVRELVSRLQQMRKEQGFAVTDRIRVTVHTRDPGLLTALADEAARTWIRGEVLADGDEGFLVVDDGAGTTALSVVDREIALDLTVVRAERS
jgi:isoleucyl-tRNA synthetase